MKVNKKHKYLSMGIILILFFTLFSWACSNRSNDTNKVEDSSRVAFPTKPYNTVKIISLQDSSEFEKELKEMPYLDGDGAIGMIDSVGQPITNRIRTIELTRQEKDSLDYLFRPVESQYNYKVNDGDCSPIYQHAIVYFDQSGQVVGFVNICFMCDQTMFVPRSKDLIGFDRVRGSELRSFFRKLGYPIESRP